MSYGVFSMLLSEFQELLVPWYPYLKIAHIVSFTAWMAGMFYLPRLFVYHTQVKPTSETAAIFSVMERKLLKIIMNPAMISTWAFGLLLSLVPGIVDWSSGWWHTKLTAVILMSGAHGVLAKHQQAFAQKTYLWKEKSYRIFNEVPTVLLIIIVTVVVLKSI